jgi:hypothetical protein
MGSYRGGKDTTEYYRSLDVRWLYRRRILDSAYPSRVTWSRGGEETASIQVSNRSGNLLIEYSCRGEGFSYSVSLDWTRCNYGGTRPWFICPGRGCGRRVAVLHGGILFLCRHCHNIVFESQHEAPHYRALRKAQKIRERLGGSPNMGEQFPDKPKGMHRRTYWRLFRNYESAANRSWAPWMLKFARSRL